MRPGMHIHPSLDELAKRVERSPGGELFGYPQATWREKTQCELGLMTDRPVIATGHQALLWHPGILAKYLALNAACSTSGCATANLVVDQHVDRFGAFDVPIRRSDGTLATRAIELTAAQPDVPMGLQPPFDPPDPPRHLPYALDSVREGVMRIISAVRAHRDQPNAALQMAAALADLMSRWVTPLPNVTATDLCETTLAREMFARMADDPHTMAEHYNNAVAAVPEAGIPPLLIRDDYVEVPLWRIRPDGRRMRAYDNDVAEAIGRDHADIAARAGVHSPTVGNRQRPATLLPRALFMTALVRLGMCDLFIHGTGGANYDRAMEIWIRNWLGAEVAPIAVVSATLTLPLDDGGEVDVAGAQHAARRAWHDPEAIDSSTSPGSRKAEFLQRIDSLPHGSLERRAAFFDMHKLLELERDRRRERIQQINKEADSARRRAEGSAIAQRRDWPFPLYSQDAIDELAAAINAAHDAPPVESLR